MRGKSNVVTIPVSGSSDDQCSVISNTPILLCPSSPVVSKSNGRENNGFASSTKRYFSPPAVRSTLLISIVSIEVFFSFIYPGSRSQIVDCVRMP